VSNVRDIVLPEEHRLHSGSLRAVLLHRPDAHPVWHSYVVSLVHLRPLPELPPPNLAHQDSSHEIMVIALDPDFAPDPTDKSTLHPLHPPNLNHQLRGRTDETALALFNAFVQALSTGGLNPDTDHRGHTIAWLERWEQGN
jgi:hypothetical protein